MQSRSRHLAESSPYRINDPWLSCRLEANALIEQEFELASDIRPVKRACDHKRGGLPDGRLCGSYHERASLRSNEYCRRKAIHLTGFARPCPSAKCLKILLCRNGGAGG